MRSGSLASDLTLSPWSLYLQEETPDLVPPPVTDVNSITAEHTTTVVPVSPTADLLLPPTTLTDVHSDAAVKTVTINENTVTGAGNMDEETVEEVSQYMLAILG